MRRCNSRNPGAALLILAATLAAPALGPISPAQSAENGTTLRGDPATEAAERDRLFSALAKAADAAEAEAISAAIWSLWFHAPNSAAGTLMQQALDRRTAGDYAGSTDVLDRLIAAEPGWAEAWNQRATMRYLLDDFEGSLADIERVLALEPKHFGALSGQALILMHQGRMEAGQAALRKAVAIDPFLSERALLVGPKGQDI